jgi:hypothetical protein
MIRKWLVYCSTRHVGSSGEYIKTVCCVKARFENDAIRKALKHYKCMGLETHGLCDVEELGMDKEDPVWGGV